MHKQARSTYEPEPRLTKIAGFTVLDRTAKVYKDEDWNEFRVKFYIKGVHQAGSDYHTDSRSDALQTASTWAKETQPDSSSL